MNDPRTSDEMRKCEFCGCKTNARQRFCCDKGRDADKARQLTSKDVVSGWLSDYAEILKGRISDTEISPKDWESANQRLTEIVLYLRAAPETVDVADVWAKTAGQLASDAERYRFLRQPGNAIVYAKDRNAWGDGASGHIKYETAEQLDAAIDKARGELKASEHLDPLCNCPVDSWGIVRCQEDSGIVRCRAEVNAENGNPQA